MQTLLRRLLRFLGILSLLAVTACSEPDYKWSLYDVSGHLPDLEFSLKGVGNKTVTQANLKNKTVLVFFGYASCPDVCPTTMAQLTEVLAKLGDDARDVRILFISVDPHRDTPDLLQAYVDAFNKNAIGLTGNESEVAATLAAAKDFRGGLNAAVNCAGILGAGRVLGKDAPMPLKNFAGTVMVNLVGSFNVAKAAANLMQHNAAGDDGERGVIVNTASVAAFDGQIGQAAYAASKAGVAGLTLPAARELARHGIRVVTIAPGIFATPMMAGLPQEVQDSLGAGVPFPARLGQPDEFAALVAHIIGNQMLNGEVIRLDGALRMPPR